MQQVASTLLQTSAFGSPKNAFEVSGKKLHNHVSKLIYTPIYCHCKIEDHKRRFPLPRGNCLPGISVVERSGGGKVPLLERAIAPLLGKATGCEACNMEAGNASPP